MQERLLPLRGAFSPTTSTGRLIAIETSDEPGQAASQEDGQGAVVGGITAASVAQKAMTTISDLGDGVMELAGDLVAALDNAPGGRRPKSLELSFGLELSGEGNIKLVKAGAKATIQMKMLWEDPGKTTITGAAPDPST